MSQAVATLSRNLISIFVCILLAACNGSYTAFESDDNFDVDVKTADIEQDNAESMALATFQAAFLGHSQSAAYLFLDASDLPEDLQSTGTKDQFHCENKDIGTVTYTATRTAGEAYKVGDKISVTYVNCSLGEYTYNGRLSAKYTKLRGLNTRFSTVSTNECVETLQKELTVKDVDIIYVTGDEIRFTKVSDQLKVDVYLFEDSLNEDESRIETIKESYYVHKDDESIFILRPINLPQEAITSVNGDQVYSVVDAENTQKLCQHYERTLKVKFEDFSTNKTGYLYTALNGSVTLFEAQENESRFNQAFVDSDFKTTVRQGGSTEVYTMKDYRVEKSVNTINNSYSYQFEGLVSNSNIFGGQVEITAANKLFGYLDNEYPHSGGFELKAQDLERVYLVPNNQQVLLQVDYNGDSTGNGFSDIDIFIDTTWAELFAHEFKE